MTNVDNSVMDFWLSDKPAFETNKDIDYETSLKNMEKNIPELKEKLKEIKNTGSGLEAMKFAISIISMPEYQDAISAKEYARYERKEFADKKSEASALPVSYTHLRAHET